MQAVLPAIIFAPSVQRATHWKSKQHHSVVVKAILTLCLKNSWAPLWICRPYFENLCIWGKTRSGLNVEVDKDFLWCFTACAPLLTPYCPLLPAYLLPHSTLHGPRGTESPVGSLGWILPLNSLVTSPLPHFKTYLLCISLWWTLLPTKYLGILT